MIVDKDVETNIIYMKELFGNHDEWVSTFNYGLIWNTQQLLDNVNNYIQHKKYSNILQIGVGYGIVSEILINHCYRFFGIDINSCCINFCKHKFPKEHTYFNICDGKHIPDFGTWFDLIISLDSMVHMHLDIVSNYLEQCKQILAPNGIIIIHHPSNGREISPESLRSNIFDTDVDNIIDTNQLKLLHRIPLTYIEKYNRYNDSISILTHKET